MNILEASKDIFASIVGSGACVYIGQPFDTIKVRMQVNPAQYASAVQSLKTTVTNEALTSLWKGSIPAFTGALSENAVAFGINGALKRIFSSDTTTSPSEGISVAKPILTGAITGAFTAVCLCPSDVVKCRIQMTTSVKGSAGDMSVSAMAKAIVRQNGVKGLFVGLNAQLLRDIPFGAAFFGSYEILCQLFKRHSKLSDSTIYFMSGG